MTKLSGGKLLYLKKRTPGILRGLLPAIVLLAAAMAFPGPHARGAEDGRAIISRLAQKRLLLDAAAADGLMVVVGERGHILSSLDGGRTWKQAAVPTRVTLTGVFLHDRNLGWAVGHDGVILRTRDGGADWTLLHVQGEEDRPLLDVFFTDADRGFAVGAYGLFLTTADGGDTWKEETVSEDDWHLNQMARSANGRLYIAAEAGNFFRSDDGGTRWVRLSPPYSGSFFGTLPLEGDRLLLFGLRGHLFRSEDAGDTWQRIETGTDALLSGGLIRKDGSVVVVGQDGVILESRDDGRTFEIYQFPDRTSFSTALETPDGALLLVGEAGVMQWPE